MPSANDAVWLSVLPDMSGFGKGLSKGVDSEAEKAGKSAGSRMGGAMKVALVAGGVAIGAALSKGVIDNINIGKANDKLAAQLGLSAKESSRIGKVAGDLYRDAYGDSIEGVNDAVGAVMSGIKGMADASSKDLKAVTATALDFATAFEVDVTRATQIAGQMMSTGLAKDATEAFDLITAASQRVPAALREDMLDATDEYGQFFSTLGYTGEESMALLVDASEKGMYGIDKLGDAVKEFTIRSTDMSTASKDAYKAIGLDADEMANKILKGGGTAQKGTQQVIDGLLSMKNPAKQAEAAIALFGTPLEDLNASEIPAFLKSMQGGSTAMDGFKGSAKEMGDTLNDNFATRMEGWKRQLEGFVQDGLMKAADWGGKAFAWAQDNQAWLVPLAAGLGTVTAIIGTLVGAIKLWTTVVKIYTGVQAALNVVMAANPIGLVVLAIAGLVVGLTVAYKRSETFRNIVNGAFQKVKNVVSGVVDWFKNTLVPVFTTTIPNAFKATIDWVKRNWPVILAVLTGPIGLAVLAITKNWDKITGAFKAAKDWVVGAFKTSWNAVKSILMMPLELARDGFNKLLGPDGPIRGAFSKAVDGIERIWTGLQRIAKAPVKFLVETVYNNGLRKMINLIPGVPDLPEVNLAFASGGILPGYTPGRDVHSFVSPTAGRLDLSGGEAIMRPEWTKRVGAAGVGLLNAAARKGGAALENAMQAVMGGQHGPHRKFFLGGVMPLQGGVVTGVHAASQYPWASWAGDINSANDLGNPPSLVKAYKAGVVAQRIARPDSYGNHYIVNHDGGSSLYAHLSSFIANVGQQIAAGGALGRVGSTGNSTGAHLHFEARGGSASAGAGGDAALGSSGSAMIAGRSEGSWLSAIGRIKDTLSNVKDGISKLANMSGGFAGMISGAAKNLGNSAIQWINDKIPNRLLPDNPIPKFDNGGWMMPGSMGVNHTSRPEPVFTDAQWSTLRMATRSAMVGGGRLEGKSMLAEQKAATAATRAVVDEVRALRGELPPSIRGEATRVMDRAAAEGARRRN